LFSSCYISSRENERTRVFFYTVVSVREEFDNNMNNINKQSFWKKERAKEKEKKQQ